MPNTALLIPVKVNAWLVNSGVLQSNPYNRSVTAPQNDYSQLAYFDSPENTQPLTNDKLAMGIYLKWDLPEGLRHSQVAADNTTAEFPIVPNRWLVVRTWIDTTGVAQAKAWVVESNYQQSGPPYNFPDPEFPQTSSTSGLSIGRAVDLKTWPENAANNPTTYSANLTAAASGDIHFSHYTFFNNNVFSFHDDLTDNQGNSIEAATVNYFVNGWHAELATDPVSLLNAAYQVTSQENLTQAALDWQATLHQTYRWQVNGLADNSPVDPAQIIALVATLTKTLYHGLSVGIPWQKAGNAPAQSIFDASQVKCALGNSTAEALAALATQSSSNTFLSNQPKTIRTAYEQLATAFQNGQLAQVNGLDNTHTLQSLLQETHFSASPSGILWKIIPPSSASSVLPEYLEQLDALNQQQVQLNQKQALLKSLQWQLYAFWWDKGSNESNPPPDPQVKAILDPQLDVSTHSTGLTARIAALQKELTTLSLDIDAQQATLKSKLSALSPPFELKHYPDAPFYEPVDPVVLITNVQAPVLADDPLYLTVRTTEQLLTSIGFSFTDHNTYSLTTTSVTPANTALQDLIANTFQPLLGLNLSKLPAEINNLWQEFLLVSAGIQQKNDLAPLQSTMSGQALPDMALAPWAQPWHPLWMEWIAAYTPIDTTQWQFDATDNTYQLIDNPALGQPITLTGRTTILPHGRLNLSGQLAQSGLDKPELVAAIQQWDCLSQRLEGLTQQLSHRENRLHRTPSATSNAEQAYAYLVGDQAHCPPGGTTAIPFQALRQGWLQLSSLVIIDQFGQSISVPSPNATMAISAALQATPNSKPPEATAQLAPRVPQPLRLRFDWLSALDDSQGLTLNSTVNPVCGWLLPNYLDQSFQIYAPDGSAVGELRLIADQVEWAPSPNSLYTSLQELVTPTGGQPPYIHLGHCLLSLQNAPSPMMAYTELQNVITQACEYRAARHSPTSDYLAHFIGRPLVLARAGWQFEYAGLPLQDQTLSADNLTALSTLLSQAPHYPASAYPAGQYALRLGNPASTEDGLVGFFNGLDYTRFHSVYPSDTTATYTLPIDGSELRLALSPLLTASTTTLLFDPRAPIHAYTDLLPVFRATLPTVFAKLLHEALNVTFQLGPVLAPLDPISMAITLSKPLLGGTWSWLQRIKVSFPLQPSDWQTLAIQNTDTVGRFSPLPNYLTEGWLQLRTAAFETKAMPKTVMPLSSSFIGQRHPPDNRSISLPGLNFSYKITPQVISGYSDVFLTSPVPPRGSTTTFTNQQDFTLVVSTGTNTFNGLLIGIPCEGPQHAANEYYNLSDNTTQGINFTIVQPDTTDWTIRAYPKAFSNPPATYYWFFEINPPKPITLSIALQINFTGIVINQTAGEVPIYFSEDDGNTFGTYSVTKQIPSTPSFIGSLTTASNQSIINYGDGITLQWQMMAVNNMSVWLNWLPANQIITVGGKDYSSPFNLTPPSDETHYETSGTNKWAFPIDSLWSTTDQAVTYNFWLTASPGSLQSNNVTLTVNPLITSFTVSPSLILLGCTTTLCWTLSALSSLSLVHHYVLQVGQGGPTQMIGRVTSYSITTDHTDANSPNAITFTLQPYSTLNQMISGTIAIQQQIQRIQTIGVGRFPQALAFNNHYLCTANSDNTISYFDLAQLPTPTVNTVFLKERAKALAFAGNNLWIACADAQLLYFDPAQLPTPTVNLVIQGLIMPGPALAYDGHYLWAASAFSPYVSYFDPAQLPTPTVNRVSFKQIVTALAFDGHYLWAASAFSPYVSYFDPAQLPTPTVNTVSIGENVPGNLTGTALAFDGHYLWVRNFETSTVSYFDLAQLPTPTVNTVFLKEKANALAFDGHYLWVTSPWCDNVFYFDPAQFPTPIMNTVHIANPIALAFDGHYLWVANSNSNTVSYFDPTLAPTTASSTVTIRDLTQRMSVPSTSSDLQVSSYLVQQGLFGPSSKASRSLPIASSKPIEKNKLYSQLLQAASTWEQCDIDLAIQRSLEDLQINTKQALAQEASQYGFECYDVLPDGNCFFHALADQLTRLGQASLTNLQADTIKERALQFILKHSQSYSAFFAEDEQTFINGLLDGEWADNVFIHAAAKALNVTLAIIESDASVPKIINKGITLGTVFLGHEILVRQGRSIGLHYQSLLKKTEVIPVKKIEDIIATADEDHFENLENETSLRSVKTTTPSSPSLFFKMNTDKGKTVTASKSEGNIEKSLSSVSPSDFWQRNAIVVNSHDSDSDAIQLSIKQNRLEYFENSEKERPLTVEEVNERDALRQEIKMAAIRELDNYSPISRNSQAQSDFLGNANNHDYRL